MRQRSGKTHAKAGDNRPRRVFPLKQSRGKIDILLVETGASGVVSLVRTKECECFLATPVTL